MDNIASRGSCRSSDILIAHYRAVRDRSLALTAPLTAEDAGVQSMPSASPVKWHLAHVTWFFEQFVLARDAGWRSLHPEWDVLFNSYYQSAGPMHARAQRGLLSRPTLAEVVDFRHRVDEAVCELLARDHAVEIDERITLGLNHEQQHQELMLTDIKHMFSLNPLEPAYHPDAPAAVSRATPLHFLAGAEGIVEIGDDDNGFAYDNERPRHRALLHPHAIANRPISNAEFRAFIEQGGYAKPLLWMSEGWATVQREGWRHPLYWSDDLDSEFTLAGRRTLDPHAPVCHVSFYEADAFARWAGARLPTEFEWEYLATRQADVDGNFQEAGVLHPRAGEPAAERAPQQLFGDVWEWTSSPYVGYPGFKPLPGALGEYNGKFMCGQWVLRGGSCATPRDHFRITYRNFFYPDDRWQFMGLRLGRDA